MYFARLVRCLHRMQMGAREAYHTEHTFNSSRLGNHHGVQGLLPHGATECMFPGLFNILSTPGGWHGAILAVHLDGHAAPRVDPSKKGAGTGSFLQCFPMYHCHSRKSLWGLAVDLPLTTVSVASRVRCGVWCMHGDTDSKVSLHSR